MPVGFDLLACSFFLKVSFCPVDFCPRRKIRFYILNAVFVEVGVRTRQRRISIKKSLTTESCANGGEVACREAQPVRGGKLVGVPRNLFGGHGAQLGEELYMADNLWI